eukprot:scaffold40247_cov18-Tisochrysis_lutea.AAC.1
MEIGWCAQHAFVAFLDLKLRHTHSLLLGLITNNFERGQNDVFEVEGAIGNLRHIYIGHDNTNLEADWHLQ